MGGITMGLLTDEQIKQLIKEKNLKTVTDVHNALKEMFGETIQRMLEAELENELGYSKYNYKESVKNFVLLSCNLSLFTADGI